MWFPLGQMEFVNVFFAVKVDGASPTAIVSAVRSAVQRIDPELPLSDVQTMEARAATAMAAQRLALRLVQGFAALTLLLAGSGLYGLLSYVVHQRRKELGIRAAVGATRADLARLVLRESLEMSLAGAAACLLVLPMPRPAGSGPPRDSARSTVGPGLVPPPCCSGSRLSPASAQHGWLRARWMGRRSARTDSPARPYLASTPPPCQTLLHFPGRLRLPAGLFPAPEGDTFAWKGPVSLSETRLKIALFIDFDNIEIGVKTTLGGHFDVGAVSNHEGTRRGGHQGGVRGLTRAGDYGRSLTQHAIQMVQRNLTPGGDKNGADINLALDALEMAFTHSHINAFVIVGGDSDFMALVEKLKLYDRQVFVVGGRAFTSVILEKNCTEFIAHEKLHRPSAAAAAGWREQGREGRDAAGRARPQGHRRPRGQAAAGRCSRAPAATRLDVSRSASSGSAPSAISSQARARATGHLARRRAEPAGGTARRRRIADHVASSPAPVAVAVQHHSAAGPAATPAAGVQPTDATPEAAPVVDPAVAGLQADGYAIIRDIFLRPRAVSRWPLYVRQAKQVIRTANETFDERRHGLTASSTPCGSRSVKVSSDSIATGRE